ncbi:MAG: leucine-rich repeat protein [Oscillospiraceae bacterium]
MKSGVLNKMLSMVLAFAMVFTIIPAVAESNVNASDISMVPVEDDTVKLTLDANSGTFWTGETIMVVTTNAGNDITLPTPVRQDYIFSGWLIGEEVYTDLFSSGDYNTETGKVYEYTATAVWEYDSSKIKFETPETDPHDSSVYIVEEPFGTEFYLAINGENIINPNVTVNGNVSAQILAYDEEIFEYVEDCAWVLKVTIGANCTASYKKGTVRITALNGETEVSAEFTIISDVILFNYDDGSNTLLASTEAFQASNGTLNTNIPFDMFYPNSFRIESWPDKTVYYLGDEVDTTGLKVTATVFKKNDQTGEYEEYPNYDITEYCLCDPTIFTFDEAQNVTVYFTFTNMLGNAETASDTFRVTFNYDENVDIPATESVEKSFSLVLGESVGYSDYLSSVYGSWDSDKPCYAISSETFGSISGGRGNINGDGFTIEMPLVSSSQKGINFVYTKEDKSLRFYDDTPIIGDYSLTWDLGMNYYELRESFDEKLEESDIITYYIYKNDVCVGKMTVDYMTADIFADVELKIDQSNSSLGEYRIDVIAPDNTAGLKELGILAKGYCGGDESVDGKNLSWVLTASGSLTINGKGPMKDYNTWGEYRAPWMDYSDKIKTLNIQNGVTTIGDYAFYECSGISGNLSLPDSITNIGNYAFESCSGFCGKLTFPQNLKTIGDHAFMDCNAFTGDLVIPDGVTSIGGGAFAGCSGFNGTLLLPSNINTISSGTFGGCTGLRGNIVIPEGVTSIGNFAFDGCGFNGTLTLPSTLVSIGEYAFDSCTGFFGKLTLPQNLKSIGDCAFRGCNGFTGDLVIPDGVTSIGGSAFESCSGFNGVLTLPSNIDIVSPYAFGYCTGFRGNLVIPEGVTSIGDFAFDGCGFNGTLTLPSTLVSIGGYAFSGCSSIKGKLELPEGIKKIGYCAFERCSGFSGTLVLPGGLETIEYRAFSGCDGFSGDLTIPAKVTKISNGAFSYCYGFDGILTIEDGVEVIGENAFQDCNGFSGVIFKGNTVKSIGEFAFGDFGNENNEIVITIPASVDEIGTGAFRGAQAVDFIVSAENKNYCSENGVLFDKNKTTLIQYPAMKDASEYKIPDGVTIIATGAFSYAGDLRGDLLPDSLEKIEDYAFSLRGTLMGKFIIPENVEDVGANIFGQYICDVTDEIFFKGDAPSVYSATSEKNSFGTVYSNGTDVTLYYLEKKAGWSSPKWCGYNTAVWDAETGDIVISDIELILPDEIVVGNSVQVNAVITPENANRENLVWSVTNETGEAYISQSGVFTAVKAGTVTVTVMSSDSKGVSASTTVVVKEADTADAIISFESKAAYRGGTVKVSVNLSEASNVSVMQFAIEYDASKLEIASYTEGELLEGLSPDINIWEEGLILISWDDTERKITMGGELLEIEFIVKDSIKAQDTVIGISKEETFIFQELAEDGLRDIDVLTLNGKISISDAMIGDVNLDGKINVIDANMIRRSAVRLLFLNDAQKEVADVNGDGNINVIDANLIRRYIVNLIDKFPAGT